MGSLIEKLYEKLWRQVGGKPWTELVREDQRRSPPALYADILGAWDFSFKASW